MSLSIRPRVQLFHIIGALRALLLAALLSGCSAVKLGYNNAPELSYWWLDSYLDFDDTQTLKVRADLAALQAWHRQNELPVYIDMLDKLQRMAPSNVTSAQVCDLSGELKTRFQKLVDQTEPAIVALAPTFKAEQLKHLARQFDKRNQKWRAEWIDASMSYRETLRRQQDALQTLQQLQTGALPEIRVMAQVRALLGRSITSPDAAYRRYQDQMTQESCKAFATLHNSTTPTQRLQVMKTLSDYATDARALMAAGLQ